MRYDKEHKARTHERVLAEAAAAIRAEGVERVGVAKLMERAGLTHGGFYAHFKSKDDLVAQAVSYMFDQRYASFLQRLDHSDPRAALRGFIDFYLSATHRDRIEAGCPIPPLASQMAALSEDARARYREGVARLHAALAGLLERAGQPDPETAARSLMAEMVGALAIARTESDMATSDAMLAASRAAIHKRFALDDQAVDS